MTTDVDSLRAEGVRRLRPVGALVGFGTLLWLNFGPLFLGGSAFWPFDLGALLWQFDLEVPRLRLTTGELAVWGGIAVVALGGGFAVAWRSLRLEEVTLELSLLDQQRRVAYTHEIEALESLWTQMTEAEADGDTARYLELLTRYEERAERIPPNVDADRVDHCRAAAARLKDTHPDRALRLLQLARDYRSEGTRIVPMRSVILRDAAAFFTGALAVLGGIPLASLVVIGFAGMVIGVLKWFVAAIIVLIVLRVVAEAL